jgi:hypothetical protein
MIETSGTDIWFMIGKSGLTVVNSVMGFQDAQNSDNNLSTWRAISLSIRSPAKGLRYNIRTSY